MTDCDRFKDALYDEDARRALSANRPLPAALEAHLAACADCRRLASELRADLPVLRRALDEAPPPRLDAAVLARMQRALPPRAAALFDWRSAAMWAAAGGALAVCALVLSGVTLPLAWQAVAVLAAGSAALSADVTLQALDTPGI